MVQFTNWKYKHLPVNIYKPNDNTVIKSINNPHDNSNYIFTTGYYKPENRKNIMNKWGLIFDGKYRENELDHGVLSYVEKYKCSSGIGNDCLYNYNFCLNTSPFEYQPTGALNASNFNKIEFEFSTTEPQVNQEAQVATICNEDGRLFQLVGQRGIYMITIII